VIAVEQQTTVLPEVQIVDAGVEPDQRYQARDVSSASKGSVPATTPTTTE